MATAAINPRRLEQALDLRVLLAARPCRMAAAAQEPDRQRDLLGVAGCDEALALTQAARVRAAAAAALEAGADLLVIDAPRLAGTALEDGGFALAYAAAELACQAIDSAPGQGRRRFLLGRAEAAGAAQLAGLIAGGVDAVLAPPSQAAEAALAQARAETGQAVPLLDAGRLPLVETGADALSAALRRGARLVTGHDPRGRDLAGLDAALRRAAPDGWRPAPRGVAQEEVQTPSSLSEAAALDSLQDRA